MKVLILVQNVLVCRRYPQWWVKLADFGLSKRHTAETAYRTQTGTESYMAPEILDYVPREDPQSSAYTTAVDLWALGCIVYRLAAGAVPFPPGPALGKFCENPLFLTYHYLQLHEEGINFIRSLLVPIPRGRLRAQQALDHPWLQSGKSATRLNQCRGKYTTDFEPRYRFFQLFLPSKHLRCLC